MTVTQLVKLVWVMPTTAQVATMTLALRTILVLNAQTELTLMELCHVKTVRLPTAPTATTTPALSVSLTSS